MKRAVVLWTGGKDSCLALYRAFDMGLSIVALATFVPQEEADFKAHSVKEMVTQAKKLGLNHYLLEVKAPYLEGYRNALAKLKRELEISCVITGDIDLVDGLPNWINQCCETLELEPLHPLWQQSRECLLKELVARGIAVRISWINSSLIPSEWLGRVIDSSLIDDLRELSQKTGIDMCGENGEYHTMMLEAPRFSLQPHNIEFTE